MPGKPSAILCVTVSALTLISACSSSSPKSSDSAATSSSAPAIATPTTRAPAPPGPAATLSGPITGGNGISLVQAFNPDLGKAGYTQNEYFASGTASSYKSLGPRTKDGIWSFAPSTTAPYRTRIVVRKPRDPKKFNGTVLVEWMNVSVGLEAPPEYPYLATEILRSGYAWVGVSAQLIAVSGGTGVVPLEGVPPGGLRAADPARYGSLRHPGDKYSLDMFTQVGRALRTPGKLDVLGALQPKRLLAMGESQSAFQMTTYIDAIQPTARVYDGFFVHSRGGGAIPVSGGDISTGILGGIRIRDDIDVPVFIVETETDEQSFLYFEARQPDSPHLRLWDLAGAAHADAFIAGGDPFGVAKGFGCKTAEVNTAPTHYVASAALSHLNTWIRTGTPPPSAPRMKITLVKGKPVIQRDARGNAIGGVRTAANDVPIATLSGVTDEASILCSLFGSTVPFDHATLVKLYGTKAQYLAKFRAATDKAIASGYILAADRAAILAEAAKINF
jgi:hypothetical protein